MVNMTEYEPVKKRYASRVKIPDTTLSNYEKQIHKENQRIIENGKKKCGWGFGIFIGWFRK